MKVLHLLPQSPQRPCVLTIGSFDGVHRGHALLLQKLKHYGEKYCLKTCVLTFEPHPKEFFSAAAVTRIYFLRDKVNVLRTFNIDQLLILRFDARLAKQTAEEFIQKVIHQALSSRYLIVGPDFRFGKDRAGDIALLQSASAHYPFELVTLEAFKNNEERVASSLIRKRLAAGQLSEAAHLLGRPYRLLGHLARDKNTNHALSVPLFNLNLFPAQKNLIPAVTGMFVVHIYGLQREDSAPLAGMAYIGLHPSSTKDSRYRFVIYLFSAPPFPSGKIAHVEFLYQLCDKADYSSIHTWQAALSKCCRQAESWLATYQSKQHEQ